MLTPSDLQIIDHLHGGFPLVDRPFQSVACKLNMTEDELIERLKFLLSQGVLTRFGPLFQIERAGGVFVLAALSAPESRFDEVTLQVNQHPEVAHNYRREHHLNMWFVVAAENPEKARVVLDLIEKQTQCPVFAFPKEKEFFVEFRLPLKSLEDFGYATIE